MMVCRNLVTTISLVSFFCTVSLHLGVCVAQDTRAIVSPRIQELREAALTQESDAESAFWDELAGKSPLIEPVSEDEQHVLVTFLWRGDTETETVLLMGGIPAAELHKPLVRLLDTNVWFRTELMHKASRLTYAFRVNAPVERYASMEEFLPSMVKFPPQPDPLNPNRSLLFSVLELPLAPPQPWIEEIAAVEKGQQSTHKLVSEVLGIERHFTLYKPSSYGESNSPCSLLVCFDEEFYTNELFIPGPTILDNLIASHRISPTVAVFVKNLPEPDARIDDLACSTSFSKFVATELVPWVRQRYRVSTDPKDTIVCGVSLGGLGAAYCGLRHSDVFGNVLSQSGTLSYAPGYVTKYPKYDTETGWLAHEFAKSEKLPLRFYLDVGLFERFASMNVDSVLEHRRLRDVLRAKGYPVAYSEFYGGHDYICLRGSLADGLIALLGRSAISRLPD